MPDAIWPAATIPTNKRPGSESARPRKPPVRPGTYVPVADRMSTPPLTTNRRLINHSPIGSTGRSFSASAGSSGPAGPSPASGTPATVVTWPRPRQAAPDALRRPRARLQVRALCRDPLGLRSVVVGGVAVRCRVEEGVADRRGVEVPEQQRRQQRGCEAFADVVARQHDQERVEQPEDADEHAVGPRPQPERPGGVRERDVQQAEDQRQRSSPEHAVAGRYGAERDGADDREPLEGGGDALDKRKEPEDRNPDGWPIHCFLPVTTPAWSSILPFAPAVAITRFE